MKKITVVYSEKHLNHQPLSYLGQYGREEHPEKPARITSILSAIKKEDIGEFKNPEVIDKYLLKSVHSSSYLKFLKSLKKLIKDEAYYFPLSFYQKTLKTNPNFEIELGKYSVDISTPVNKNIFEQALVAVNCAYTAAKMIKNGEKLVYSLSRPPGHHVMKAYMGGSCYLNNCAVAAQYLSDFGKVAVLDVDYHHGNGTQDIFYERGDVLTVSLHADPQIEYPYHWGFEEEGGVKEGEGKNINIVLQKGTKDQEYHEKLVKALEKIDEFKPQYLIVSLGFDTYVKDQVGGFKLTTSYYQKMASTIKQLNLPTVIIQEGGYYIEDLGKNAVSFLKGF